MNFPDFEIIDFHTHPFSCEQDNICSHKAHCDMSTENIRRDMIAVGTSKICGSVIWEKSKMAEYLNVAASDLSDYDVIVFCNRKMLEISEKLGDFYVPGMMVHPDYVKESCDDMQAMYDRGVRLVGEIVPYFHGWNDYSCEGFSKILDCATELNMIVSIHSMGDDAMDIMTKKHPDTKIVFAHPGEYFEFMRHLERMKMSKNCYLDLSGYGMFRHGMLRVAIDELGADRILYGSDYPTCNPAMYVGGVLLDPLISDTEKKLIFADNARRLFADTGLEI